MYWCQWSLLAWLGIYSCSNLGWQGVVGCQWWGWGQRGAWVHITRRLWRADRVGGIWWVVGVWGKMPLVGSRVGGVVGWHTRRDLRRVDPCLGTCSCLGGVTGKGKTETDITLLFLLQRNFSHCRENYSYALYLSNFFPSCINGYCISIPIGQYVVSFVRSSHIVKISIEIIFSLHSK